MDKSEGIKIDMIPKWLKIGGTILRFVLTIIPFLIAGSVMIWGMPGDGQYNGHFEMIWMALWFLSLLQIINLVDIDYK